ncbi:NACHT domain-containing protein [Chlorogloeopsis fritschii PCC 9212]|uniref:NACHT domain-containing protein n=1 Tax=Chlorogloeopsis fritschii PCC 6912 TaxID=211165 RepID=A0A433NRK2_CHLFR|nr:NACHT domain-containing protein [Chlorogloeopsis fritschii]RUR86830.1 hypothetical protein PCC6912_02730 [Chlorogloeopsis fritschii PCC 6912]
MNQQPPLDSTQRLNIDNASIQDSQILQARRDLIQIHKPIVYLTVGDKINISDQFGRVHSTVNPFSRPEDRNRKVLLNKVKKICSEVLENSLHIHALIELGLEKRLDAVKQSFSEVQEICEYSKRALPSNVGVTAVFNQMGEGGTLLILGEPGSGKTTTLVRLTLDLISRAQEDYNRTIPVVLNLSSWARERQTIADWIVQRLQISYGVSKALGKFWVEEQKLLLLLDGLDEVRAECRESCVQAINKFLQKYGSTEIVVCSRVREYEALSTHLKLQEAICIQPLTPEQIKQYFEKAGDQLVSVKTLIDTDSTLHELAKSPLMLSIMTLVYRGVSVTDLLNLGSIEERRKDLFNKYIGRMFEHRNANQQYSRKQTMHWLIWLAKRMSQFSQAIFLIEEMQAVWLPIFGLATMLILGLDKKNEVDSRTVPNQGIWRSVNNAKTLFVTIGLLVGLLVGVAQVGDILDKLISGLVNGLIFGTGSALIAGQGSGIACVKHFILRCLLWLSGHIPWNYAHFLDYACERIFLQKVGGGYIFVHRMLREHFAQMGMVKSS